MIPSVERIPPAGIKAGRCPGPPAQGRLVVLTRYQAEATLSNYLNTAHPPFDVFPPLPHFCFILDFNLALRVCTFSKSVTMVS